MRDEYMNELQMLDSFDEILEGIEIMRRIQLDDIEKASRLLLMAREIQTKLHEKNRGKLEIVIGKGSGRFANEVGDSVSRAHLQLGVEIINVLKTHVGLYGIVLQVVHDKEFYKIIYSPPYKELLNEECDHLGDTSNYGSGVARPKIEEKDSFELKGQFLKELRENTFRGSDNEDANEHIKKVLEIVGLFHVSNITVDQLMLRVFHISLTGAASRWLRNEPTGSTKTWEDLKTKFLNKYCPPGRTAKKMEKINNFQ
ncbi:hypothetical protein Tco_0504623 [Tanacetum coccineum]